MQNKFKYFVVIKVKKKSIRKKYKAVSIKFMSQKWQRQMLNQEFYQVINFINITSNKKLLILEIELKILKLLVIIFVEKLMTGKYYLKN